MVTFGEIALGVCGGLATIVAVAWFAIRPYLAHPGRKPCMPDAIEQPDNNYGGAGLWS